MTSEAKKESEPEAPSMIARGDYVQDRLLHTRAGAKTGWRNRTPLEKAEDEGQLNWPGRAFGADRFKAGKEYARRTRQSEPKGIDSSQQIDRVMGSRRDDVSILDAGRHGRWIAAVDSHLSHNDRQIVRRVCGQDERPSVVIPDVCGSGMAKSVSARFCEALDNLIDAMETVRREPGSFNVSRVTS